MCRLGMLQQCWTNEAVYSLSADLEPLGNFNWVPLKRGSFI